MKYKSVTEALLQRIQQIRNNAFDKIYDYDDIKKRKVWDKCGKCLIDPLEDCLLLIKDGANGVKTVQE